MVLLNVLTKYSEKLAKIAEETTIWDEFVDPAFMAYHMTKYAITGVILFLLVYSKEAVLPIDEPYDLRMKDRMMQIVKEVPHIREEAWCMIQHFQ